MAGTLVETEDGLRPIETVELGDFVWARDAQTGETALKEVTHLFVHDRMIWDVALSGEDGASEVFETTDDHPWWIVGPDGSGQWRVTEDLTVGMTVVSRRDDGPDQFMTVTQVTATNREDTTYNFTVADFHTYFVGENRVLVHNCNAPRNPDPKSPFVSDNPYSPESVDRRRSDLRESLGLSRRSTGNIPDQNRSPGGTIQGGGVRGDTSRGGDPRNAHTTGERNVNSREEHSRTHKGNDPGPRRRPG